MPISVVIGGQYGSEGKGKVAAEIAKGMHASTVVRCGGSNSGHTVYGGSRVCHVFRHLPTACLQTDVLSILVSGSYIDVDILLSEIESAGIDETRLAIDPYAVVVSEADKGYEYTSGLISSIGSTGSGTGAAVARRISRSSDVVFAKDVDSIRPYVSDTKHLISTALSKSERVVIEGTQGFGLSILHSDSFPYATSRDTTASGFLSECGCSPLDVDDIVMVIRAHPIRVAGPSGPLPNETTWEYISKSLGDGVELNEYTTVTKRLRRVAHFDAEIVKRAIRCNNPTRLVLNHLDYIHEEERREFVQRITLDIGRNIDFIGLSPYDITDNPHRKIESFTHSPTRKMI